MQAKIETQKKILSFKQNFDKLIIEKGNQSIKNNKEKIQKAFDIIADILQLTKDEFGQIVLEKNIKIASILIEELNLGTKSLIASMFYSIKGLGTIDELAIKTE